MIPGRNPVLFVMAPGGAVGDFSEHLGTAFLRTVLSRAGIATWQYLPQGNPSLAGFVNYLHEIRPPVIGFTVYESNLNTSRALVRVARQALPGVVLLVGGPNATFTPAETLEILEADVCVRGAAEGTVTCLLRAILGAESASTRLLDLLGGIPNLVVRVDGGARATWTADLSSFPGASFPTLDDVPSPFINSVVSTPDVGYVTARGCNQHCTYCSFSALSGRRVAFHSVERVLDDLQAIEALAAVTPPRKGVIDIWDDTFSLLPARVQRICEGILERGIRLPLRCVTRADRVTPDLLQLMRRAGFNGISFGLESAVPRVLRAIGKVRAPSDDSDPGFEKEREFLERIRSAVRAARDCGLNVRVSVIGGLPGESASDFRATLDFVSALGVESYAHNVLCLLPGTPLYESRHAFGLEAYREVRTGRWRTTHAYDVDAVAPLAHSTLSELKRTNARRLADALCGRAGEMEVGEGSVWAVVIRGFPPSARLAGWLRSVLSVGGWVVSFAGAERGADRWRAFLYRSGVPFGTLACLVRDGPRETAVYQAYGPPGAHRVQFVPNCSPELAGTPLDANIKGDYAISVWPASAPETWIGDLGAWRHTTSKPALQVADACRLWSGSRRCDSPRVLHVDARGRVRACWYGPVIGELDGSQGAIVSGARADGAETARGCPLGKPRRLDERTYDALWDLDLAAQLSWLTPLGGGSRIERKCGSE